MSTRRLNGFYWNAQANVGANAYSDVARSGWGYDNFAVFLTVSGPTSIVLCIANEDPPSSEGVPEDSPHYEATTNIFLPAFYLDTQLRWDFSQAGAMAILIPDFTPLYSRLKNLTAGVTITASWLASGD